MAIDSSEDQRLLYHIYSLHASTCNFPAAGTALGRPVETSFNRNFLVR